MLRTNFNKKLDCHRLGIKPEKQESKKGITCVVPFSIYIKLPEIIISQR